MRIVAEVIATRAAVKDKIWGEQLNVFQAITCTVLIAWRRFTQQIPALFFERLFWTASCLLSKFPQSHSVVPRT